MLTTFQAQVSAPSSPAGRASTTSPGQLQSPRAGTGRSQPKSHNGCRECKARRVKCDETFPVCLRCQRRGSVCFSAPRAATWNLEIPGLVIDIAQGSNKRLLKRWFERTSSVIVLDPDTNPLSFPILSHLGASSSLVHAVQSITAGHEADFDQARLGRCLEERGRALATFRSELSSNNTPPSLRFWTCYLLGISSSYVDQGRADYGRPHLVAAHDLVTSLLADERTRYDSHMNDIVGTFVYWDLSCSALLDPDDQIPRSALISDHVRTMSQYDHTITGTFTELFYFLGDVGRYCRKVLEGHERDFMLETFMESELLCWDISSRNPSWTSTAEMFCLHGHLLLSRICGSSDTWPRVADTLAADRTKALRIIHLALGISPTSNFVQMQATPLLTAASELSSADADLRDIVRIRFKEIVSYNHLPGPVWALRLLEDVWAANDNGSNIHWLEMMLRKSWKMRLE